MNQARSGRFYAANDFEAPHTPIPWALLIWLVVVTTIMASGAAFYADKNGFERGRAYQANLVRPTCPVPAPAPQISRKECINACFAKERMAAIKGVEG